MYKYKQTDELQLIIDWANIMGMPRCAGGHDEQMKGLLRKSKVIAHYNEGNWQGTVATCVRIGSGKYAGKYAIYNDYYGCCSGCDSWEGADDASVKAMCIGLANGAYIFNSLNAAKAFLQDTTEDSNWNSWRGVKSALLREIIEVEKSL